MTRSLSLAHLSAITLPPPDLIRAAHNAGFDAVGLRLLKVTPDSPGYPLMDDPALLRETLAALADTGLRVSDIEFVRITPELQPESLIPLIAAGAMLGAGHVICAPYDDNHTRLALKLGQIGVLCKAQGMGAVLEFFPWTSVPDLRTCWDVVQEAGPELGLLVDALHFDRSCSSRALLRQIPPARLPFAHLCDALCSPPYTYDALLHTAREARLAPGHGEIDLVALLAALPAGLPLGVEVPTARDSTATERLRALREAANILLMKVEQAGRIPAQERGKP